MNDWLYVSVPAKLRIKVSYADVYTGDQYCLIVVSVVGQDGQEMVKQNVSLPVGKRWSAEVPATRETSTKFDVTTVVSPYQKFVSSRYACARDIPCAKGTADRRCFANAPCADKVDLEEKIE